MSNIDDLVLQEEEDDECEDDIVDHEITPDFVKRYRETLQAQLDKIERLEDVRTLVCNLPPAKLGLVEEWILNRRFLD